MNHFPNFWVKIPFGSQKGAKNANFVQGGLSKPPAPFGRVNAGNDKK